MDPDLKFLLALAILLGAAAGVLLALLTPPPVPDVIVLHSDPAAYEIASLLEEARRIAAEAAADDT